MITAACNLASSLNFGFSVSEQETLHQYLQKDSHFIGIKDGSDFDLMLDNLAGWSSCLGICVVLLGVLICWIVSNKKTSSIIRKLSKSRITKFVNLKVGFFLVWLYAFIVYDIGMYTSHFSSLFGNAPMAVIYAFKVFLLESDVSEIHDIFHSSWIYSFNFALVHFLAAFISTWFIIKHFGYNAISHLKMLNAGNWGKKVDDTYVFFGLNDASVHLIESIKEEYEKEREKKCRIIIVRSNNSKKNEDIQASGLYRIFNILSMPSRELAQLIQLDDCLTTETTFNLTDINVDKNTDIIGGILKLRSLKKLLRKKRTERIHLLFLGNEEKENIHSVSLLLNDNTIKQFPNVICVETDETEDKASDADDSRNETGGVDITEEITSEETEGEIESPDYPEEVVFYCHARYNSIHRVIEDTNMCDGIRVKVVDSSQKSLEILKQNKDLLPVQFVNVEKDATVSSEFNALVVGFSEVGMESVRFLYEFGAFVKTGSTNTNVERSPFHLDVVDNRMSDLAGVFVANANGINISLPFIKDWDARIRHKKFVEKQPPLITLRNEDCRSIEFYEYLKDAVKRLNYIVIATDDDELNITLGVRILKMSLQYRIDRENLIILVRARSDEDGHIQKIANHYNLLYAAQKKVEDLQKKDSEQEEWKQDEVKKGDKINQPLHIFGLEQDIYTYKYIIDNYIEKEAIKYKERYKKSTKNGHIKPKSLKKYAWYKDFNKFMRVGSESNPTYFGMVSWRRKMSQDIANSLHEITKIVLGEKAMKLLLQETAGKKNLMNFNFSSITRINNTLTYKHTTGEEVDSEIKRILYVLAQTEHLRWNASHEILGFEKGELDEIRMKHNCLAPWNELSEKTQSFDSNVVDLALDIKITYHENNNDR